MVMVELASTRPMAARSEPGPESAAVVTTSDGVCNSTAPMSANAPTTRGKPRWSVVKSVPLSQPSMAGEPGSGGMVCVGPP